MRLLDRIRALFAGSEERAHIPQGRQVPDEDEGEIEELVALDII